jgi:hypothetical protein
MTASTPIAKLVEAMLADGAEHGAIVSAVTAAETSIQEGERVGVRRGTRLPMDWMPPDSCIAYAAARGMPEPRILIEAERFKNYWTAKTGAGATKRDWEATWRNWILNAMEDRHVVARNHRGGESGATAAPGRPQTGANAVLAGMGRLAHRLAHNRDTARYEVRQAQAGADTSSQPDPDRGPT